MRRPDTDTTAWTIVLLLAVISAGAYLGNESAQYFWDLKVYVTSLDSPFPYRFEDPYPFLYPPVAKHLFTLARSHLFEFLSIAYVAAGALLVSAFGRLNVRRKFEWLFAMTSIGGLGVVSLMSGNVAILLNLAVLGVSLYAATGSNVARLALPLVIFGGALIKPQFIVYAGLLLLIELPLKRAVVKAVAVIVAAVTVHAAYMRVRPDDWHEYTDALLKRTAVEKDFAWGPAGFIKQFSDANSAAFAAFIIGFLIVAALAYQAWRRSTRVAAPARISLAFVALTFANPRMPPYDVFVALLALAVCCAYAARPHVLTRWLAGLLAINLAPWVIKEFTRTPGAWPSVLQNVQLGHLLALVGLLATLAVTGLAVNEVEASTSGAIPSDRIARV